MIPVTLYSNSLHFLAYMVQTVVFEDRCAMYNLTV